MKNNTRQNRDYNSKQQRQANIEHYEKVLTDQYVSNASEFTAPMDYVAGDIKIRYYVLLIVGILLILLVLCGIVIVIFSPQAFTDYWKTVIPIISGAIFGLIGFVVGQKFSTSST